MAKVKQWLDADTVLYTETKQVQNEEKVSLSDLKLQLETAEKQLAESKVVVSNLETKITDLTGTISTLELDTDRPA